MRIEDATSKEDVEAALAARDDELLESIEEGLDDLRRKWERKWDLYVGDDFDIQEMDGVFGSEELLDAVIAQVEIVDLGQIRAETQEALSDIPSIFKTGSERDFRRGRARGSVFEFDTSYQPSVYFPENLLPEWADFVPTKMAEDFWAEFDVEWDVTDVLGENTGFSRYAEEGPSVLANADDLEEWALDLYSEVFHRTADQDPEAAYQRVLGAVSKHLRERLIASKLPKDEVVTLGKDLFGGRGAEDYNDMLGEIEAYLDDLLQAPRDHEVILEISPGELRDLGIRSGVLIEEAPWKLVKLNVADLRQEGVQMRHCVGDKGMGYAKAVREGEIEIWSFRSRNGKPRFTLEVDPDSFPGSEAIRQLKGKANRTPGYESRGGALRFPEEVILWEYIFSTLEIDPSLVVDFGAYRQLASQRPQQIEARPNPRTFNTRYRRVRR